jgi:hypothetical protein
LLSFLSRVVLTMNLLDPPSFVKEHLWAAATIRIQFRNPISTLKVMISI